MVSLPGTLLVVDDDEANRDMLSRRLERKGFSVTVAEDGSRAIELVRERPFDLVLLDVLMPGLSGLEVLRELRQEHPATELPVIMATALSESGDVVEALRWAPTTTSPSRWTSRSCWRGSRRSCR